MNLPLKMDEYFIKDSNGFTVADAHGDNIETAIKRASFIVKAVNSHEALLEAAKQAVIILGRMKAFGDDIGPDVCKAQFGIIKRGLEKAITHAEGK